MNNDVHEAAEADESIDPSAEFVEGWVRLTSSTNWEKGCIVVGWRRALIEAGAQAAEYSDQAWATLVGGVTSQHVGRLRRVVEIFETPYPRESLTWSHFQSALDWDDATDWLDRAVAESWSVSQMRAARWEELGETSEPEPTTEESEADDQALPHAAEVDRVEEVSGTHRETEPESAGSSDATAESLAATEPAAEPTQTAVRPFEQLAELPDDVAEAFEQMKLVILSHKLTGWDQITRSDMVKALDALVVLAGAKS